MVRVEKTVSLSSFVCKLGLLCSLIIGTASADAVLAESEASNLFQRISDAFRQNNYDGVFVYSHGSNMETLRIVHRLDDGAERERIVRMDGPKLELIRNGDQVTCVHTADWKGDVNHRIPAGPFAKAFIRDVSHSSSGYQVELIGQSRIVGREAMRFAITPKDEFRYGYQIWLDKETGLLLKSVLLHANRVLERFQFTQIDLTNEITDDELDLGIKGEVFKHQPLLLSENETIEQKKPSWRLTWMPDGFIMRMQGIRRAHGGDMQADTLTYSDGMTAFSIFVEKAPTEAQERVATQKGATVAVARVIKSNSGNHFVTVVGEVPMMTAQRLADSIVPVEETEE
ncbi:MAG: MucB/RseB C-terminal domain-containing protein [Pseudomonadales bacterium]|nr:MucB/RseB C-terminal domain-containing protein [Pseudomonadales bacterium]